MNYTKYIKSRISQTVGLESFSDFDTGTFAIIRSVQKLSHLHNSLR